jgi:hypothetical protein
VFRKPIRFALLLLTTLSLVTTRAPADPNASPPPEPVPTATGLPEPLAGSVTPVVSTLAASLDSLRPVVSSPLRIFLISSGIDTTVFQDSLRSKVSIASGSGDAAGYGTYATTALFQLTDKIRITSYSVFNGTRFEAARHESALGYALRHASEFDAVLDAVPGAELLDPTTLMMATTTRDGSTEWSNVLAAAGDNPLVESGNVALGISLDGAKRAQQMKGASLAERRAADYYAASVQRWQRTTDAFAGLEEKGLPVVVPAGDLGPAFQTIFGIANLPQVVTVGAYNGRTVAATSASGPSIDMHTKPDLLAPGNLVGLLPKGSLLDQRLPIDSKLAPSFADGSDAAGGDPVRVDSTIPAAAVVAAQVAALATQGLHDADVLRGALTMAAVPLDGVPVWRQGAGAMTSPVNATDVLARGVAVSSADLGDEPASGSWSTAVEFFRTQPLDAQTTLADFAGIAPNGKGSFRALDDSGPVTASVGPDGVTLTTGMGERYEGGLYCGYTSVSLPGTHEVTPTVSTDGLPAGLREDLPTCLLNGSRLVMHGFYIHDQPAENLTFALLPDLPARDTVMSGLPKRLPVDPFDSPLYQKVTPADGDAILENVPPAYYRIREFSDYGAPVTFDVKDAQGRSVSIKQELGDNPGYQDVVAFVLSAFNLTENDLKALFGPENVEREKPTGAYLITVVPAKIRVILGWMKKMPGASVASRYVDLIDRDDLAYFTTPEPAMLASLDDPAHIVKTAWPLTADGWLFDGVNAPPSGSLDPGDVVGRYNPAHTVAGITLDPQIGVATYPFAITQPNYKTHFSVNFGYQLNLAAVAVIAQIGPEVAFGLISDGSVAELHTTGGGDQAVPTVQFTPSGRAGRGGFSFDMHSHGLPKGTLTFLFIPGQAVGSLNAVPSRVQLSDISLRIATWTNTLWPATMNPAGMGHAFDVVPNVSFQMNHTDCRAKTAQRYTYDECEDWTVMVHSPGEDASMVNVRSRGEDMNADLRGGGARFFDPRRGTSVFDNAIVRTSTLPVKLGSAGQLTTNGRFWEQLAVPLTFLRLHPGPLHFEILDNVRGRDATMLPHEVGGVRVAPYVPYDRDASSPDLLAPVRDLIPQAPPGPEPPGNTSRLFAVGSSAGRSRFICDLA